MVLHSSTRFSDFCRLFCACSKIVKLAQTLDHGNEVKNELPVWARECMGNVGSSCRLERPIPTDVTDLYHGLRALTTHLRPSNYSVGHKRLERVPSNSSNIAAERYRSSPTLDIDDRKQTLFSCYFSISTAILDFLMISDFIQISVGFLVWNDSFIIFVISPQKYTKKYTLNKVFIDFWYRHFIIRSSIKAHGPHPLKVRWVTSKLLKKSVDQGVCLHYASDFWSNSMVSRLISTVDFHWFLRKHFKVYQISFVSDLSVTWKGMGWYGFHLELMAAGLKNG